MASERDNGQAAASQPAAAGAVEAGSRVTRAWLEGVLDIAADAIVVIDEMGRILVFNKACEQMFGYTQAEMLGRNVRELMPPVYSEVHDTYLHNYLTTGVRKIIGIGREVQARHKLGEIFPVELSVGEADPTDGRQFIGILRDLRPRKAFEQRLGQLQGQVLHMARLNAVDEMGAVMAHELNQPLTALMLYLQTLGRIMGPVAADGPPAAAMGPAMLDKALKEAQRAASIIQRMRTMVEKKRADFEVIDLRRVVQDTVEHTTFVAQGSTVPIRTSVPAAPVDVEADPVQIQQIISNLLRNAVEVAQTRDERWVSVMVMSTATHALVSVQDSGPGIPPEVAETLFRSFATTKRGGMGLGLAISRSLAQNHGGDLTVEPGGPENGRGGAKTRGATFTLSLPFKPRVRSDSDGE